MIVLACETSTLLGSAAVIVDGKVVSARESMRQGSHSDLLNKFIYESINEAGIKLADVDLFATGLGPGSFTGIRISLNTIKAFGYCFSRPVVGVNSLEVLAAQVLLNEISSEFSNLPVISMVNAYKNMCYVATFQKQGEGLVCTAEPSVVRVQNLSEYFKQKSIVVGDGYSTYHKFFPQSLNDNIVRISDASDQPHASLLGQLAINKPHLGWVELLPLYLRASEAEENLKGIKFQPLF